MVRRSGFGGTAVESPGKRWLWSERNVFWDGGGREEKAVCRDVRREGRETPRPGVGGGRGMVKRGASVMMCVPRGMGMVAMRPRPLEGMGRMVYRGEGAGSC